MVTSYWARRSHRLGLALCIGLFVAIALVSMTWTGSYAQSSQVTQARITQILNGNQVYIQNRQAAVNAIANRGQRIHTERSRAELRLNNGAVGRMGRNTALVVGRDCVRVRRGQLLVNGASRGCTNQMVLGVRGTTYVLEVDEADNATITVLEGQVDLILGSPDSANTSASASTSRLKHPGDGPAPLPVIPLSAGVRVTVDAAGQIQNLQALSQPEFTALLTGPLMANYPQPLPGQAQLRQSFQTLYPDAPFPNIPGADTSSLSQPGNCTQIVADYRREVEATVDRNWTPSTPPAPGRWEARLNYTINQNGEVDTVSVTQSSGDLAFDQSATDAVWATSIAPLPSCYGDSTLTINHRFELNYF